MAALPVVLFLVGLAQASPVLEFRLQSPVRWLSEDWLAVQYELQNVGSAALHIAQHPGVALAVSCATGQGTAGAVPGGVWSTDGRLARKYFVQLAPGDALIGEKSVQVPKECRSAIEVTGVYQSESGEAWGLSVPGQRFYSKPLAAGRRP